jgi:hypothetical protein
VLERPAAQVAPGTRVKVVKDPNWNGPWATEFMGTIAPDADAPIRTQNLAPMPEVNVPDSDRGSMREFLVHFDEPQLDCHGQGPYRAAVIWEKYLRLPE